MSAPLVAAAVAWIIFAVLVAWWRDRVAEGRPLTMWGARRMKRRARAQAPDWGPELTADERAQWRRAVGAYFDTAQADAGMENQPW